MYLRARNLLSLSKESKLPSATFVGFEGRGRTLRTLVELGALTSVDKINTSSLPFHATIAFCADSSNGIPLIEIIPISAWADGKPTESSRRRSVRNSFFDLIGEAENLLFCSSQRFRRVMSSPSGNSRAQRLTVM